MSGVKVTRNTKYHWRKDHDKRGEYYWLVAPDGKLLGYVDTLEMAIKVLDHLNRKEQNK